MDDLLATSQYTGPFAKFSTSFQSFAKKLGDAKSKAVNLIYYILGCQFFLVKVLYQFEVKLLQMI